MALITSNGLTLGYSKHEKPVSLTITSKHGVGSTKDLTVNNKWDSNKPIVGLLSCKYLLNQINDASLSLPFDDNMQIQSSSKDYFSVAPIKDTSNYFGDLENLYSNDSPSLNKYYNILPYKDVDTLTPFNFVQLTYNKPNPPNDNRYIINSDFVFNNPELATFNGTFIKPINYDIIRTILSPVDAITKYPWVKGRKKDIVKDLKWGYAINKFLVGGNTASNYLIDYDATVAGYDPKAPETTRVIRFVNIVNITTVVNNTTIQFTDFTLSQDVDSVAWSFSMNVPNKANANLVKPTTATVVELSVNINGVIFLVFVSKTKTVKAVNSDGTVTNKINCTGYSVHKLLSYPYSPKSSFTEVTQSTPAGIISNELVGTGFTASWIAPSWTIPANTYSYISKSILAAISELASSISSVIVPTNDTKDFTIKSRYPFSPWTWATQSPDFGLNESNFFSIDTEWIPQESPDSIYVFGDNANGVGVKCVVNGKAGVKTLPSIIDKYMTDTVPAAERGRVEIAKNGFLEIIPISTYVDPAQGVIPLLSLVEVTEVDGVTKWKALVIAVSLTLKRNGNALVQNLSLERHYDAA